MRICLLGAGATGGHFAVKLARAGHDVSVVARGAQLEAIERNGLRLLAGEEELNARVQATARAGTLGTQDLVIVTVKTTALASIAEGLEALVGNQTAVVFPQNGMGWWYPIGLPAGRPAPPALPIFQLADHFNRFLRIDQILPGAIYSANEVVAPGVVRNTSPGHNALLVGALSPGQEDRLARLRHALDAAGIASADITDVRLAMWGKLLVNMSGSIIALVTENKSSISRTDPALAAIHFRANAEGLEIARAHGYALEGTVDPLKIRAGLPDHKPSILQDYERRRPMEIGEIIEAPLAFARAAAVATPTLDTLAAIAIRRARDRGLY
ncbi:MAG: 2-dehydropantoate 2-reductase [Bradyrhizobium sp.]